jgi:hypothetical protein
METALTRLPLLFSYRNTFFGPGVPIEVRVANGRALYVEERDGGWLYGVNPGGMAAPGASLQHAHDAFRQTFTRILVDMVLDTKSEDEYRTAVERFGRETNEAYETEWLEAVVSRLIHAGGAGRGRPTSTPTRKRARWEPRAWRGALPRGARPWASTRWGCPATGPAPEEP